MCTNIYMIYHLYKVIKTIIDSLKKKTTIDYERIMYKAYIMTTHKIRQ
jgi:hypothetical protein